MPLQEIGDLIQPNNIAKFEIHHAEAGNSIAGMSSSSVGSNTEGKAVLSQGLTTWNATENKGHLVLVMRLSGVHRNTGNRASGVLNLVDLAAPCESDVNMRALHEVVGGLAGREQSIPYRSSKLTHVIQPCLGENAKTVMFVNVKPDAASSEETLTALRFATKVNSCHIGRPRKMKSDN